MDKHFGHIWLSGYSRSLSAGGVNAIEQFAIYIIPDMDWFRHRWSGGEVNGADQMAPNPCHSDNYWVAILEQAHPLGNQTDSYPSQPRRTHVACKKLSFQTRLTRNTTCPVTHGRLWKLHPPFHIRSSALCRQRAPTPCRCEKGHNKSELCANNYGTPSTSLIHRTRWC